jgi:hypothetical protein
MSSASRLLLRSSRIHIARLAPLIALVALGLSSCSSGKFTACEVGVKCAADAGGNSSDAGTDGGSDQGGMSSGGSAGGGTAGNGGGGEAGAGGSAPCADACKESTPVCDPASNTCVQCLTGTDCKDSAKPACNAATHTCVECTKSTDCADAAKPACDTATNRCVVCVGNADCKDAAKPFCDKAGAQCVACLKQADCTSATASACSAGVCTACTTDAECSNIAGKGVCDAGTCVQCTGTKFVACGQDSGTPLVCDSLKRTCTTSKQQSAGLCQTCVSDAQCRPGQMCVLDKFGNPAQDVGYFCHWKKGDTANGAPTDCFATGKPYAGTQANVTSIDGTVGDICVLRTSTCVARSQFSTKDCVVSSAASDAVCGFAPTKDSKCAQVPSSSSFRCTMTCLSDEDCPGAACDAGAAPPVCSFN